MEQKGIKQRVLFTIKAPILFENIVNPKQAQDDSGRLMFSLVLRLEKKSEAAQEFIDKFKEFVKLTNLSKDKALELGKRLLKDGDKDPYWSKHASNHGFYLIQPHSYSIPNLWHKEGKAMIKVKASKETLGFGDEVRVVLCFLQNVYINKTTSKKYKYQSLFLQEVLVLEKNEAVFDSEATNFLAESENLEVKKDLKASKEDENKQTKAEEEEEEEDSKMLGLSDNSDELDENDFPF